MRIWHEQLIPHLCQKHLCAVWREGLGCYKIITEGKSGYRNHPAMKEFDGRAADLWDRLSNIRTEMLNRGYKPKGMPMYLSNLNPSLATPWQSLEQQVEILKGKGCKCKV